MRTANATVIPFAPRAQVAETPERDRPAPVGNLTYTVAEVAALLSLNLGGTYRMIRDGHIPAHKLGGRWVVPRKAFHAWLESCIEVTPAEAATNRRSSIGDLTAEEVDLIWAHRNRRGHNGA